MLANTKICLPTLREHQPSRKVKLLPGSMLQTVPCNCAPGGEPNVTNMVSPINWFDMLDSVFGCSPLARRKTSSYAVKDEEWLRWYKRLGLFKQFPVNRER